MPVTIISVPGNASDVFASYRPIQFTVECKDINGNDTPPVVYCDIYFAGIYYKTISRNSRESLNTITGRSVWKFDIQDPCQEIIKKYLSANGDPHMIDCLDIIKPFFVKFRASYIDSNNYIESEVLAPIQGTSSTPPVSGLGTQSANYFCINATLQHESNQNLTQHLDYQKAIYSLWNPNAKPLSERTNYKICAQDTDTYGILSKIVPSCITVVYKLKNYNKSLYANLTKNGVVFIEKYNRGSNYQLNDSVVFSGGGGFGATGKVTKIDSNGAIDEVQMTYPGIGYTSLPVATVISQNGSGATILVYISTNLIDYNNSYGVSFVKIDNYGSSFSASPTCTITDSGGGTGASADVYFTLGSSPSTLQLGNGGQLPPGGGQFSFFITLKGNTILNDSTQIAFTYDNNGSGLQSNNVTSITQSGWTLPDLINDLYNKIYAITPNVDFYSDTSGYQGIRIRSLTQNYMGLNIIHGPSGNNLAYIQLTNVGKNYVNPIVTINGVPGASAHVIKTILPLSFPVPQEYYETSCQGLLYNSNGQPISGGGGNPPPTCNPVGFNNINLADAQEDVPYNQTIQLTGQSPFGLVINSKPSWLAISISGSQVRLTGTPAHSDIGLGEIIDLKFTNCTNSSVPFIQSIDVQEYNLNIIYTNNVNIHAKIEYGLSSYTGVLFDDNFYFDVHRHSTLLPFATAQKVKLTLSDYNASNSTLANATLVVDGITHAAPTLTADTAEWTNVRGNVCTFTFSSEVSNIINGQIDNNISLGSGLDVQDIVLTNYGPCPPYTDFPVPQNGYSGKFSMPTGITGNITVRFNQTPQQSSVSLRIYINNTVLENNSHPVFFAPVVSSTNQYTLNVGDEIIIQVF